MNCSASMKLSSDTRSTAAIFGNGRCDSAFWSRLKKSRKASRTARRSSTGLTKSVTGRWSKKVLISHFRSGKKIKLNTNENEADQRQNKFYSHPFSGNRKRRA